MLKSLLPTSVRSWFENNPPGRPLRQYASLVPKVVPHQDGSFEIHMVEAESGAAVDCLRQPAGERMEEQDHALYLRGIGTGFALAMDRMKTVQSSELQTIVRDMRRAQNEHRAQEKELQREREALTKEVKDAPVSVSPGLNLAPA